MGTFMVETPALASMVCREEGRSSHFFLDLGDGDRLSFSQIGMPRPIFNFDWRSEMNIKSLLIGSAAALVAVSGARAADAVVVAEPEPVEYVRVCDASGAGVLYIPGTETCLKISG